MGQRPAPRHDAAWYAARFAEIREFQRQAFARIVGFQADIGLPRWEEEDLLVFTGELAAPMARDLEAVLVKDLAGRCAGLASYIATGGDSAPHRGGLDHHIDMDPDREWDERAFAAAIGHAESPRAQADCLRAALYDSPFVWHLRGRALTVGAIPDGAVRRDDGPPPIFVVRSAGPGAGYVTEPSERGNRHIVRAVALIEHIVSIDAGQPRPLADCVVGLPRRAPFIGGRARLCDSLEPISPFRPAVPWLRPQRSGAVVLHLSERAAGLLRADMADWRARKAAGRTEEDVPHPPYISQARNPARGAAAPEVDL